MGLRSYFTQPRLKNRTKLFLNSYAVKVTAGDIGTISRNSVKTSSVHNYIRFGVLGLVAVYAMSIFVFCLMQNSVNSDIQHRLNIQKAELKTIAHEKQTLKIEISQKQSLKNIEAQALKMGMVYPDKFVELKNQ